MRIVQLKMIYLELISNARDNVTLRLAMNYKINSSLTITNLNCIQHLHHNEIKYQGEAIPILCSMDAHGLQPEVEFSNFLALQISNTVSQTLDSNNVTSLAKSLKTFFLFSCILEPAGKGIDISRIVLDMMENVPYNNTVYPIFKIPIYLLTYLRASPEKYSNETVKCLPNLNHTNFTPNMLYIHT